MCRLHRVEPERARMMIAAQQLTAGSLHVDLPFLVVSAACVRSCPSAPYLMSHRQGHR